MEFATQQFTSMASVAGVYIPDADAKNVSYYERI